MSSNGWGALCRPSALQARRPRGGHALSYADPVADPNPAALYTGSVLGDDLYRFVPAVTQSGFLVRDGAEPGPDGTYGPHDVVQLDRIDPI